jgi:outer membrane lipoprotein-sorting protein
VAPAQSTQATDPALWAKLTEVNHKSLKNSDLVADFEQQKFTPLLKKPMTSTGTVKARGSVMLWDTVKPAPTKMRVDEKGVGIYYPKQKTLEVFPIDAQLGALAASPLPDLKVLKQYFTFEAMAVKDLDPDRSDADSMAIHLKPANEAIGQHVSYVNVLLDTATGFLRRIEMVDRDNEKTVIKFSNLRGSSGLKESEMELNVPEGTKVVKPLENLGPPPSK